jgi:radical SAM superfamily enzyme YgiQ (UPF0313 family)
VDLRLIEGLRALRADESGDGLDRAEAPLRMALVYPSPYRAAMSSLGFLQIHRLANARPGTVCERAVRPDDAELERHRRTRTPLLTLERQRPVGDFDLIGISLAYELELAGVVEVLELAGLAPRAADRDARDPLVVIGGPLSFSNPLPAGPFADLMILGEAELALERLLDALEARPEAARGSGPARRALLETLASEPGFFVPSIHGEHLPPIGQAPDDLLPAYSALRTPHTELHDMHLVEPERGCHRGCTFCVMRRSTNGGMRLVPPETVLATVPEAARRVGLVGAAVSDHPGLEQILTELVDVRGKQIGVSSLRADRLNDRIVGLLARGGYRSMTVALDAASERLRHAIEKNLKVRHVERAAELARAHGMRHLKIYTVVCLPDETDEDLDELVELAIRLSATQPVVLGLSPFVPKFHTPLARAPFVGEREAARTLQRVRHALRRHRRVEVRGPGPREAWVEYRLSQGGFAHAEAAIAAAAEGGSLAAWKRALRELPERVEPRNMGELVPAPTRRRPWLGGGLPILGT